MISFKIKNNSPDTVLKKNEVLAITKIDEIKRVVEFSNVPKSPKNLIISVDGNSFEGIESLKDQLFFDGTSGSYRIKAAYSPKEIKMMSNKLGHDRYPYLITREYEAVKHLSEFKDAQVLYRGNIVNDRAVTEKIKYTFGLEFETSMGFIPQELCFKNGLVPLRDGSITGVEYSTIVLSNKPHEKIYGTELLQQQLLELREKCFFNKECALHIHLGGFPVEPKALYILHLVENRLESANFNGIIPKLSFMTSRYKRNGKDYCMKLPEFYSFNDMFKYYTGMNFLGSLEQPHPNDTTREQKWRILTRYYGLNFINMLCYSGPKTVEFRFLRPTFNYRKIRLWLLIFNAILQVSEQLYEKLKDDTDVSIYKKITGSSIDLESVISSVYDPVLRDRIYEDCELLKYIVNLQEVNGDYCGDRVDIENRLFEDIL